MPTQPDLTPFVARAVELGALEAKVIDVSSVVTAAWVRMKCKYGCGCHGTNLCCPPHSPTPEETQRVLDCYERGILLHFKAFGYGAGPCFLCEKCNLQSCVHAYEARPAMEACGIDVFATVRANGYPIEVVTDRECDQNHYALLLVE